MNDREARTRLTKAQQFLEAAESDLERRAWTPAAGAAYYAAYHAAIAYLRCCNRGPGRRGRWDHGHVQSCFRHELVLEGKNELALRFERLYTARIVADYQLRFLQEQEARNVVDYAKEVIAFCKATVESAGGAARQ